MVVPKSKTVPTADPVITDEVRKIAELIADPKPENSRWDDDILRGVLLEIQDDGENALSLGFSAGELKKLLDEPDDLEVKEIETGPVDDEFWISVRGPLSQQANALKALEVAMKPYAGVSVEQGTINIG